MRILQGHRRAIRAVAYAPGDPETLATAGDDGTVRFWNPGTSENYAVLTGHPDAILALAFNKYGNLLVSGGRSGSLFLWDVALLEQERSTFLREGALVGLGFVADRQTVCAGMQPQGRLGTPGQLLFWDSRSYQPLEGFPWPMGVEELAFTHDGRTLAVANSHREVTLFDPANRTTKRIAFVPSRVRCLAFSPAREGRLLAVGTGRVVECWDVGALQRRSVCQGPRSAVNALAFAPDGRTLLTSGSDRLVRLWDVDSGRELAAWDWQIGHIHALAFAPDGMTAAAGGEKRDLVIWDVDET